MEVIAKTTNGVIISASNYEVNEILKALTGTVPKEIEVGQKLPAIDYAGTITKIKSLSRHSSYDYLLSRVEEFNNYFDRLKNAIRQASDIEV